MAVAKKELTYECIPSNIDTNKTLRLIRSEEDSRDYFHMLKTLTNEDDQELSGWLDISVKTFRSYKNTQKTVKSALAEHVIMLISLFKHGVEIFGSPMQFKKWLVLDNFYFDNKPPVKFIGTISGLKFIDDRLTSLEYGDNA